MTSGCRIGKIKLKSGGSLTLLSKRRYSYKEQVMDAVADWTKSMSTDIAEPVGFVAIAWDRTGTHTIHDYFSAGSTVFRSMGPHYVAECMRRRNSIIDNS